MAYKASLVVFFLLLLVLQKFTFMVEARKSGFYPPPPVPRGKQRESPSIDDFHWFTLNRHKLMEEDAFRPTSPGHSPGVGHDHPPVFAP